MKEHIERGALLSRFNVDDMENINGCFPASIARQTIKDFPAADVVKVVHAHWIHERYDGNLAIFSRCSKCGFQYNASVLDAKTFKSKIEKEYNYCPNCGAHMDERSDK